MKNSNLIIRSQRLLPEIYSDESRDFLLLTRIADAVYNSCLYNTLAMLQLNSAADINENLLVLLANKLGIALADALQLTSDELRGILIDLSFLLRNKGSLKAIKALINIYFKIYNLSGEYTISVNTAETQFSAITLAPRTIVVGVEGNVKSTLLLLLLAKYVLPPGYSFFVYFFDSISGSNKFSEEETMQLLFLSNSLSELIDQEIPDFITAATYDSYDYDITTESIKLTTYSARAALLLSAVDAHLLISHSMETISTYFLGYIEEAKLLELQLAYANALPYNKDLDPTITTSKNLYSNYTIVIKDNVHLILIPDLRLILNNTQPTFASHWRIIEAGSIIIMPTVTETVTDTDTIRSTGDIYYITTKLIESSGTLVTNFYYNKLTFRGSYLTEQPTNIQLDNAADFDYYCNITKKKPFLYTTSGEIELTERSAVETLPVAASSKGATDVRFCLGDSEYYASCGNTITEDDDLVLSLNDTKYEAGISFVKNSLAKTVTVSGEAEAAIYYTTVGHAYELETLTDNLVIKSGRSYILAGCPMQDEFVGTPTYSLELRLMLTGASPESTNLVLCVDTGKWAIYTNTSSKDINAYIDIFVADKAYIETAVFKPLLYDVTDYLATLTDDYELEDLSGLLWTKVSDGPVLAGLLPATYSFENNTILWKRGGDYYIYLNGSWQKYTYPLFFIKLIQCWRNMT